MSLFASTSPSYLILQSLDRCNAVLAGEFPEMLRRTVQTAEQCKTALTAHGFTLCGGEPMKITLLPKAFGYTGHDLAEQLRKQRIFCEFADPDHLVLMPSPYQAQDALLRVTECLCAIPRAASVTEQPPALRLPQTVCTPREAIMARQIRLPLSDCVGRICAELSVSCPPAVPVAVCGERITEETVAAMRYYGMTDCAVLA